MSEIKITTNQNEGHVRVNFLTEMATKTSTSNRPTSWRMYLTTAEQLELLNQRPCESMVEVKSPTTIGSAITLRSTIQSRGLGAPKQKFCGVSIDKMIKVVLVVSIVSIVIIVIILIVVTTDYWDRLGCLEGKPLTCPKIVPIKFENDQNIKKPWNCSVCEIPIQKIFDCTRCAKPYENCEQRSIKKYHSQWLKYIKENCVSMNTFKTLKSTNARLYSQIFSQQSKADLSDYTCCLEEQLKNLGENKDLFESR